MRFLLVATGLLNTIILSLFDPVPTPKDVSFSTPPNSVEVYDILELSATISSPDAANPFTAATLEGDFSLASSREVFHVSGFCDSTDGATFRIRFMPSKPGTYNFTLVYAQAAFTKTFRGEFRATPSHRRGPIRIDPHGEPIMQGDNFTMDLAAWPAKDTHDFLHPGFDYARFNLDHWRRFESMLRFARDRDVIVSIVLDMNDSRIHPVAGSEDERRFLRYAVARFAAFSNVTWDMGDDVERFRDDAWTHDTGTFLVELDPYHHLATSHPVDVVVDGKSVHQDRSSPWFGFTSYQEWSRNQHALMLGSRKFQEQAGRIIPQTNEEYGYEDHYPLWAIPGQESADSLRRVAWDIVMAGGYQTAGESARRGTNVWPDTGGGWVNGRGDDSMTMFLGYGHLVDFTTSFEWWKTVPHDELVDQGNYCLAYPGQIYAVYVPNGGRFTLQLQPGTYSVEWFNPLTGERIRADDASGASWTSAAPPSSKEWAVLLRIK